MADKLLRRTGTLILIGFLLAGQTVYATEPEDNSPYDLPEDDDTREADDDSDEDMEGKVLIAVRKPADFRVYSKTPGIFIVEAKNKGEITGYDIRVRKSDSNVVKNYRAMTTRNLKRRFIGGKENDRYKVKVRTFRTIGDKDYPSKWTKELQVIILKREGDGPPSSTRIKQIPKAARQNNKSNKNKSKKSK